EKVVASGATLDLTDALHGADADPVQDLLANSEQTHGISNVEARETFVSETVKAIESNPEVANDPGIDDQMRRNQLNQQQRTVIETARQDARERIAAEKRMAEIEAEREITQKTLQAI